MPKPDVRLRCARLVSAPGPLPVAPRRSTSHNSDAPANTNYSSSHSSRLGWHACTASCRAHTACSAASSTSFTSCTAPLHSLPTLTASGALMIIASDRLTRASSHHRAAAGSLVCVHRCLPRSNRLLSCSQHVIHELHSVTAQPTDAHSITDHPPSSRATARDCNRSSVK